MSEDAEVFGSSISPTYRTEGVHADYAELMMAQPPLAPLFRSLSGTKRHVTVSSLDGSTVKGLVTEVGEDGATATLENGEHVFVFDVAAVAMVQMARPEERP